MKNLPFISCVLALFVWGLTTQTTHAQKDYLASQYNFNALMLNPGYAGAHPYLQLSSMYRNQWSIKGAPTTQVLCADGLIPKSPVGVGFLYSSDRIGVVRERVVSADVSYHLRTRLGKMSFGLRAGHVGYSASLDELIYWDESDPVYHNGNVKEGFLTLGFGAFFASTSGKWFAGISSPSYFASDKNLRSDPDVRFYKRHYYAYGGGIISTQSGIDLKPSVFLRYMETSPLLMDVNLHALFINKDTKDFQVWIGAGFRSSVTYLLSLEVTLPYNLRMGYSYDFAGRSLNQHLGATHEIQLGFNFGGSTTTIQNPRYF